MGEYEGQAAEGGLCEVFFFFVGGVVEGCSSSHGPTVAQTAVLYTTDAHLAKHLEFVNRGLAI